MKKKLPINTILMGLFKSTKFIKTLKFIKAAKSFKYLITFATMLLSMLVYGMQFGIGFGIGFVILIFIHEMGHVKAMEQKGYATKAPVFIPMLGAVIFAPEIKNREDESYIGFAGPLIGYLGCLLTVILWYFTQHPIFLILSYTGIFINLFNLVPIRPLDGGRVLQITSPHIKYLGLMILLAMIISFQAVGLILILLVSLPDFMKPTKTRLILSCVVYAAMIVGFILFPQGWILTCVDLLLGAVYLMPDLYATFISKNRDEFKQFEPQIDTRPFPTKNIRFKWLAYYLALGLIMFATMYFLHPYLPKNM